MQSQFGRVAYKDQYLTVYPMNAKDSNGGDLTTSYLVVPKMGLPKFFPQEALKLGCTPKVHFQKLQLGQTVTLDDGTVVEPDQVRGEPVKG